MHQRRGVVAWVLLVILGVGCGATVESRPERAVAERSVRFLEGEVEQALEGVRATRGHLGSEPEAALEALAQAEAALDRLQGYYLPLLDLRERTESALETLDLGDVAGCESELAAMTASVRELADEGAILPWADIETLAESLEEARVALAAEPDQVPEMLVALHRRLQDHLLKGHLALSGG